MYALDVTDADATPDPRLLWRIKGGSTSGFDDLGQTWSSPTLAQIKINGKAVPVLIFGGGYDSASTIQRARRLPVTAWAMPFIW